MPVAIIVMGTFWNVPVYTVKPLLEMINKLLGLSSMSDSIFALAASPTLSILFATRNRFQIRNENINIKLIEIV
jgi:hypothetical protein